LKPGPRKRHFLERCNTLAELHPDWKAVRVEAAAKKLEQRESPRTPVPRPRPKLSEERAAARWKIRAARTSMPGVYIFYIASRRHPVPAYVAQYIRRAGQRRWFCDCADFKFRRLPRKRHCKHLRFLAELARKRHGVTRLGAGELSAVSSQLASRAPEYSEARQTPAPRRSA
jgi:hypothetical protein